VTKVPKRQKAGRKIRTAHIAFGFAQKRGNAAGSLGWLTPSVCISVETSGALCAEPSEASLAAEQAESMALPRSKALSLMGMISMQQMRE